MFHPNTDKENNGLQDIQKKEEIGKSSKGGGGEEKMRQLDPRVSIVNGRKTGIVLGREPTGRPWGAVKARRIYGWTRRNVRA